MGLRLRPATASGLDLGRDACLQTVAGVEDVESDDRQVQHLIAHAARVEFAADVNDRVA